MLHPPDTPLGRFGVETLVDSPDPFVGAIPLAGLTNPVTGLPTVAPLAVLIDFVAGLVNHYRRAPDEWTVSSELTMDLSPDALATIARAPDESVVGNAKPFGTKGTTSLGVCQITHRGTLIGAGTVRSVHIHLPGHFPRSPTQQSVDERPHELAEIMALGSATTDGDSSELSQRPNPILNNSMGIVHGGVSAAGLELAASAAVNAKAEEPLHTASLRVNYLRQFVSGSESRYAGSVFRRGRRSSVADAQAIGTDGQLALIARLTAYC